MLTHCTVTFHSGHILWIVTAMKYTVECNEKGGIETTWRVCNICWRSLMLFDKLSLLLLLVLLLVVESSRQQEKARLTIQLIPLQFWFNQIDYYSVCDPKDEGSRVSGIRDIGGIESEAFRRQSGNHQRLRSVLTAVVAVGPPPPLCVPHCHWLNKLPFGGQVSHLISSPSLPENNTAPLPHRQ